VQAYSANKAAKASTKASEAGIAEQRRQFDRTEQMTQPWRDAGERALMGLEEFNRNTHGYNSGYARREGKLANGLTNSLNSALDKYTAASANLGGDYKRGLEGAREGYDEIMARQFRADPGYQFRLRQGEKAINRGAAARGNVLSGATMQALGNFNSGLASQEYANFDARRNRDATQSYSMDYGAAGALYSAGMGRQQDILQGRTGNAAAAYDAGMTNVSNSYGRRMDIGNSLARTAGLGQSANQALIGAGQSMANNVAGLYSNIGQAKANAYQGTANAFSGTINNLAGVYGAAQAGQFGANPGFGITPSPTGVAAWGWS
jgi:hypothetical protein